MRLLYGVSSAALLTVRSTRGKLLVLFFFSRCSIIIFNIFNRFVIVVEGGGTVRSSLSSPIISVPVLSQYAKTDTNLFSFSLVAQRRNIVWVFVK